MKCSIKNIQNANVKSILVRLLWSLFQLFCNVDCYDTSTIITKAGGKVQLNCITNQHNLVSWMHFPTGSFDPVYLFYAGNLHRDYANRVQLDQSIPMQYNIEISNVHARDAGSYMCNDDGGFGDALHYVELVVVEKEPKRHPESMKFPCSHLASSALHLYIQLRFHGNCKPFFDWKVQKSNEPIPSNISDRVDNDNSQNSTVTSALRVLHGTVDPGDIYSVTLWFLCSGMMDWNEWKTFHWEAIRLLNNDESNNTLPRNACNEEKATCTLRGRNCKHQWVNDDTNEIVCKHHDVTLPTSHPYRYRCERVCNDKCNTTSDIVMCDSRTNSERYYGHGLQNKGSTTCLPTTNFSTVVFGLLTALTLRLFHSTN